MPRSGSPKLRLRLSSSLARSARARASLVLLIRGSEPPRMPRSGSPKLRLRLSSSLARRMGGTPQGRTTVHLITRLIAPRATAHAHCDIPCGIYDPAGAKTAAETVAKMVEKLATFQGGDDANRNNYIRSIHVKEEHAQLCKKELLILWTDYLKPEHLEKYPNLHDTFWKAAKLCSKNKQSVDAKAAADLQAAVKEISDIFWATKK